MTKCYLRQGLGKLRENSERVGELEHAGLEIEKAKNKQKLTVLYKQWRVNFHQK
jgi:hypothetical protein